MLPSKTANIWQLREIHGASGIISGANGDFYLTIKSKTCLIAPISTNFLITTESFL
jgi:hypothetical protein